MTFPELPLGSLLREPLRNGKSASPSKDGRGVRVFTLSAVTNADFSEVNTKASVLDPGAAEDVWAEPGDIFVERSNTPELVGTAALYSGPPRFAVFPDLLIRVRPDERLDRSFLAMFLRSERARRHFRRNARGIAGTMPKISQSTIEDLLVPVPDLPAQKLVVAAIETHFSRLDAAVAALARAKTNVKRARASVLKAAVGGRLVPTEAALARAEGRDYEPASVLLERIIAERRTAWAASGAPGKYQEPVTPDTAGLPGLPEGWCWATVDQVGAEPLSNGRSVPSQDDGFPVLRLTAMENGRIRFEEAKGGAWTRDDAAAWLVAEGDFFIMRGNGSLHRVGSAAIAGRPPKEVAYPDTMIRLRPEPRLVTPTYLLAAWTSHQLRVQIEGSARTTAGIHKVNQGSIGKYVLPLPPPPEQLRIVAEVDRRLSVLDALDTTLDANLARCARLRQAVLKRAFDGRLVPPEHRRSDAR